MVIASLVWILGFATVTEDDAMRIVERFRERAAMADAGKVVLDPLPGWDGRRGLEVPRRWEFSFTGGVARVHRSSGRVSFFSDTVEQRPREFDGFPADAISYATAVRLAGDYMDAAGHPTPIHVWDVEKVDDGGWPAWTLHASSVVSGVPLVDYGFIYMEPRTGRLTQFMMPDAPLMYGPRTPSITEEAALDAALSYAFGSERLAQRPGRNVVGRKRPTQLFRMPRVALVWQIPSSETWVDWRENYLTPEDREEGARQKARLVYRFFFRESIPAEGQLTLDSWEVWVDAANGRVLHADTPTRAGVFGGSSGKTTKARAFRWDLPAGVTVWNRSRRVRVADGKATAVASAPPAGVVVNLGFGAVYVLASYDSRRGLLFHRVGQEVTTARPNPPLRMALDRLVRR